MKSKPVRWAWCPICEAWIGATPPLLPPWWSLDRAAALHVNATGHKLTRVALEDVTALSA